MRVVSREAKKGGRLNRVYLAETLETFDKLGEILGILDLDGTLDDRRNGELHNLEVVGSLVRGETR
jgi:hypothetical protein